MEIPEERALRVARHYKYLRNMAGSMARSNSGRQGRITHEEARVYQEVAISLLGPDEWERLLNAEDSSRA